jgi:uncharacterized membrane protein YeaQ/YmgE (transglycosylase-associated protein family)
MRHPAVFSAGTKLALIQIRWRGKSRLFGAKEMSLTLESLIILLIVAGLAGAIGQSIVGYSHGGCLTSIALGFIGALIGGWLQGQLGLPEIFMLRIGSTNFPVVWAIIGAALFVGILSLITRPRYV